MIQSPLRLVLGVGAVVAFATAACPQVRSPHAQRLEPARRISIAHLDASQREAVLLEPKQGRAFVEGQTGGAGMRAIKASRQGQDVLLDFEFELLPHVTYRVHHPALQAPLEVARVPRVASPPRVVGVLPTTSSLPANVLRLYVKFSEPMSSKFLMSDVIDVVDASDGDVVASSLLDLEQPLFDRTYTRLTVIFNPGRTKRGVASNLQGGAPLEPNRRYALRVKAGLLDAEGDALEEDFLHTFVTTQPVREAIEPRAWAVEPPEVGTREDLRIVFDRLLDPYQAERRIALLNERGGRFPMDARSTGAELRLRPRERWGAGCYRLVVSGELEDVSGNRTVRAFDEKGRAKPSSAFRPISIGGEGRCAYEAVRKDRSARGD